MKIKSVRYWHKPHENCKTMPLQEALSTEKDYSIHVVGTSTIKLKGSNFVLLYHDYSFTWPDVFRLPIQTAAI